MTKKDGTSQGSGYQDHHLEHQVARQEHIEWKEATARWRQEYLEAALAFVRRTIQDLDLADFELALDKHEATMEVAVSIHEQALDRHEKAMALEQRGARGASEDFEELHHELDCRHAASREAHENLERRHRAILEALSSGED